MKMPSFQNRCSKKFHFCETDFDLYFFQPGPYGGADSAAVSSAATAAAATAVSEYHSSSTNCLTDSSSHPSVTGT